MNAHEGKMWNMIGACGWVESGHDYEGITKLLITRYNDNDIKELDDFVAARFNELYVRIEKHEDHTGQRCGEYGGDDSFGDMIHHVIGMGKVAFDTIMKDPTRLSEIDYVESFSYGIPHDPAYERKTYTLGFHQEQAANCMTELERITMENNPNEADQDVILELMARLLRLYKGNILGACEGMIGHKGPGGKNEVYMRLYNWEANDKMAMFSNTLMDAARKLIN